MRIINNLYSVDMKYSFLISLIAFIFIACSSSNKKLPKNYFWGSLNVDNLERKYLVHVPEMYNKTKEASLILVFHGGGGTAIATPEYTGFQFQELANKTGDIIIYPQGYRKRWNDGRKLKHFSHVKNLDDVGFISEIITNVIKKFPKINKEKIFAVGISNGAILSYRLACELPIIKAIAPIAGLIPTNIMSSCKPDHTPSVVMMHGRSDKLIRWEGGQMQFWGYSLGSVVSAEKTIEHFAKLNGCSLERITSKLADRKKDQTQTLIHRYPGCKSNSKVILYEIIGGGHTWPGGPELLPKVAVGKTTYDFSAGTVIFDFFKEFN